MIYAGENLSPWRADYASLPGISGFKLALSTPGSVSIDGTFFDWEQNTVVYVCYDSENVIETTWGVFQRAWKNFLFMDDGTLIIGRKRKQVAQFFDNGQMRIGLKP